MRILMAGCTGETGKRALSLLAARPEIDHIHALVRRPQPNIHPKVTYQVVDFDTLNSLDLPIRADHCICTLGTTIKAAGSKEAFYRVDHSYVINTANLAIRLGATSMSVISAIGANMESSSHYLRTKGEMEDALAKLPFDDLRLFRPSLLTGKRTEFRLGEELGTLAFKILNPLMLGPFSQYHSIPLGDLAEAITMDCISQSHQNGTTVLKYREIQGLSKQFKDLI